MKQPALIISAVDAKRLRDFIDDQRYAADAGMDALLNRLEAEIEKAKTMPVERVPADAVTMNSAVEVVDQDTGEVIAFELVWPDEADADENRISVLAPLGMAVLGYREGATVEWPVPVGTRRLLIQRVGVDTPTRN